MIYEQAEAILSEMLAPLSTADFFKAVGKTSFSLKGRSSHPRRQLFGEDPRRTLLNGFASHSGKLDHHAKSPTQPPPAPRRVSTPDEFQELIRSFHERGYTVRVPDVVPLAPELQRLARALEFMTRAPVSAGIFWSAAGAEAPVHYDKPHNIAVQLEGRKRWFISTDPPGLQNKWMQVGEPLPNVDRCQVVDVEPGDLVYIPGGTPHTVQSTTESLHLAIVFETMTVRDAMIAAIDLLSDNDRGLRETAVTRVQDADLRRLSGQVADGLGRVLTYSRSEDFLRAAVYLRLSRLTADLPPLPRPSAPIEITRETRVRQSPLAISHLRHSYGSLDFSHPGEHLAIHPGVEPELQFIASTDSFKVSELPGPSGEEVKIALVRRLVDSGFLEITP